MKCPTRSRLTVAAEVTGRTDGSWRLFVQGVALSYLVLLPAVRAAELGMQAPPLKVSRWIKGGPVDLSAGRGTNVYVVEFWATWCGPCKVSIPHLTELQGKFKDRGVAIIGISDEEPEVVDAFVHKLGEKMNYAVAVDDGEKTGNAYMRAFEIDGIPHAFVIDKAGRIAWQGHPMEGLEEAIEDILEDRYDIDAAQRVFDAQKKMSDYFYEAAQLGPSTFTAADLKDASLLASKLKVPPDGLALYLQGRLSPSTRDGLSKLQATGRPSTAVQERLIEDFNSVLRGDSIWDESRFQRVELRPETRELRDSHPTGDALVRLNRLLVEDAFPLEFNRNTDGPDPRKIRELGERILKEGSGSPVLLNEFAWTILTHPRIRNRDLDLAKRAARIAFDTTDGKDPSVADTYARAFFATGMVQDAIAMQKRAVAAALDEDQRRELQKTLDAYQTGTNP